LYVSLRSLRFELVEDSTAKKEMKIDQVLKEAPELKEGQTMIVSRKGNLIELTHGEPLSLHVFSTEDGKSLEIRGSFPIPKAEDFSECVILPVTETFWRHGETEDSPFIKEEPAQLL